MHITGFEVLIHCREAAIHPGFITVFIHQVSPVLNRWSSPGISGIIILYRFCVGECVCVRMCMHGNMYRLHFVCADFVVLFLFQIEEL